jgi:Tol biopolymer transport system component/tRNA A-37 threonylcarbamoyl transferase component Bud32
VHTTDQLNTALAGRYAIERLVGEGGMATVYLARDIKHHRQVALKVLKPELGAVLGVERFLAEIRVTANLQHPNLLPLFDSGEAGGLLFYVMPFVEGESLRAKLEREKQLPIDEAVRISLSIAAALDYAHRHGVIHRDLKPENILLHDGQPVIADFGIALAVSNAGGARVTQTGLSLGTPQYMSPEQAAGDRVIDGRSDIYSLAALTYEMIAGEPPHSGTTAQAIIAKLMTAVPLPLSTLRNSAPVHVEIAVAKALAKLPADRYSTAREFAEALEGRGLSLLQHTIEHRTGHRRAAATISPTDALKHPVTIAIAAVAMIAIGLAMRQALTPDAAPDDRTVAFEIPLSSLMFAGGLAAGANIAVSPDGGTIAFSAPNTAGTSSIFIRQVGEVAARELAGSHDAQQPFFSPDGDWVGFYVSGAARKVPLGGGASVDIAEVRDFPLGMAWSPGGLIVTSVRNYLVTFPAAGGEPKVLATPDSVAGDQYYTSPILLPDGETVLFALQPVGGIARTRIAAININGGPITRFELNGLAPLGYVDGSLVYVNTTGALFAVPFDAARLRVTGTPVTLGITAVVRSSAVVEAALSPTGTLVVQAGTVEGQLGEVELSNGRFNPIRPETRTYGYPRYSPDGGKVAVSMGLTSRSDLWVQDLRSGASSRLTSEGTVNERAEWSHDGSRLLFRTDRGRRSAIWWQAVDMSAPAEPLVANDENDYYEAFQSPDGRHIVYQLDNAGPTQADVLYRATTGDTTQHVLAGSPFIEAQARVSHDGRWVTFVTDASGGPQVVVQPYPGPGPRVQVSTTTGSEPVWARDGKRLFYRDGERFIVVTYTTTPAFRVTGRATLFTDDYAFAQSPHANYDVSPDGKRLLAIRRTDDAKFIVMYAWGSALRARMAGQR